MCCCETRSMSHDTSRAVSGHAFSGSSGPAFTVSHSTPYRGTDGAGLVKTVPLVGLENRELGTSTGPGVRVALGDQACRRQSQAIEPPAEPALLGPSMHLKAQDPTAKSNFYGDLPNEMIFLCSLEAHQHPAMARWCGENPLRLALAFLNRAGVIGSIRRAASLSRSAPVPWREPKPTHDHNTRAARATLQSRHYLPCAHEMGGVSL